MVVVHPGEDLAEVLVTVKAYPNPSKSYGETVCVAGVRLDRGKPEWIRLYPVRFRNTEAIERFKKYEVIRVPGRYQGSKDPRPESFKPRQGGIAHVREIGPERNWRERRDLIAPLIGETTTCALIASNPAGAMEVPAPSLGLIKPNVLDVTVSDGEPWTDDEQSKIAQASAPDLFGNEMPALEPPPFTVRYRYRCEDDGCRGHRQKVLDWELGQAGRRWIRQYGPVGAKEAIRQKWEDQLLAPDRDVHFYIGNQALHRRSFCVLGHWWPKAEPPTLF